MCAARVLARLLGSPPDQRAVLPAVHGEFMPPGRHLAPERYIPGQRGREKEERRLDLLIGEYVEEVGGRHELASLHEEYHLTGLRYAAAANAA